MRFKHAKVRTLDGHAYPGRPVRIEIDGEDVAVDTIVEHWKEAYVDSSFYPQEYYRVQASDRRSYVLRYSTLFKSWWISEGRVIS